MFLGLGVVVFLVALGARITESSSPARDVTDAQGQQTAPIVQANALSDGRNGAPLALAGGRPLFPLPPRALDGFANAAVEMHGVQVVFLAGEGVWVGEPGGQMVFVVPDSAASGSGSDAFMRTLQPRQPLNVSGRILPLPPTGAMFGLTALTSQDVLAGHNHYVSANSLRRTTPGR